MLRTLEPRRARSSPRLSKRNVADLPEPRLVLGLQPVREAIKRHREALREVLVDARPNRGSKRSRVLRATRALRYAGCPNASSTG